MTLTEKMRQLDMTIANYFHITVDEMKSESRKKEHVISRYIAWSALKEHTKLSLSQIGIKYGRRDHSTVLVGLKTLDDLLFSDIQLKIIKNQLDNIIKIIFNAKEIKSEHLAVRQKRSLFHRQGLNR